jgi:polyhydroxyalkanoate synthesis regulator phasin
MKPSTDPDPKEVAGAHGQLGSSREQASFLAKAYESLVPEVLRKTVLLGLGGVAMTEEGVRRVLSDLRLPREEARRLIEYLSEQSQRSKAELMTLVSSEIRGLFRTLNVEQELRRVLSEMRIKIQAEITFEPRNGSQAASRVDLSYETREPPDAGASAAEGGAAPASDGGPALDS